MNKNEHDNEFLRELDAFNRRMQMIGRKNGFGIKPKSQRGWLRIVQQQQSVFNLDNMLVFMVAIPPQNEEEARENECAIGKSVQSKRSLAMGALIHAVMENPEVIMIDDVRIKTFNDTEE